MVPLPPIPAAPIIDRSRCTLTSIFVQWVAPDAYTEGFQLFLSEKGSGEFIKVYDGSTNKDILFANVTGL